MNVSALAFSITSIERCDAWPSYIISTGLSLGAHNTKKSKKFLIQPLGDVANIVPGGAPCFSNSGIRTRGKIIRGGIA